MDPTPISTPDMMPDTDKDDLSENKRRSMNPNATSFTPTFPKPSSSDCAASDNGQGGHLTRPPLSARSSSDSRDSLVNGLGITSPGPSYTPSLQQQHQHASPQPPHGLSLTSPPSKMHSPAALMRQDRSMFSDASPMTTSSATMTSTSISSHSAATAATTTVAEFDTAEFQNTLMQQFTDKLEKRLDRHFSELVSATAAMPLSPTLLDTNNSSSSPVPSTTATGTSTTTAAAAAFNTNSSNNALSEDAVVVHLRKLLRNTSVEMERLKDKNQELRDTNHKLELQHLEATHQVARLQDFELNNQFLLGRVKELETSSSSAASSVIADSMIETASMHSLRTNNTNTSHLHQYSIGSIPQHQQLQQQQQQHQQQQQQIQNLMREVAELTTEKDALKIRSWELENKPFSQQQQQQHHQNEVRSIHFIDLENERNRLLEELSQKTVAMEDLWNKNDALMVRAKEYEKRVWELESQVASLEAECATIPRIRSELVEMEARADAADALVGKLQDMEGQVALVKSLQERIHELETTNAELQHSTWDLTEKLHIANNQHTLLAKEFESFRSKDKDDRRLEFLVNRNRELESLLSEQAKMSPDYKDEYERLSSETEKLRLRVPQLEGQAKQVALLRSKTLQLEKQIKTMEDLEPRLGEMQQLHERNLFLEGELGELEQLRARELELEHELEECKARLIQLETNKTRMNSFSGLKQVQGRARSGSVAQHGPILPVGLLQQHSQQQHTALPSQPSLLAQQVMGDNEVEESMKTDLTIKTSSHHETGFSHLTRTSHSISSLEAVLTSPRSPKREFPPATIMSGGVPTSTTATWPSGRSSMSLNNGSHRMSTSSSTSTVVSHGSSSGHGGLGGHRYSKSLQHGRVGSVGSSSGSGGGYSAPVSPEESEEDEITVIKRKAAAAVTVTGMGTEAVGAIVAAAEGHQAEMTKEPESFVAPHTIAQEVI